VCVPGGRRKALADVLALGGAPRRPPGLPGTAMPLAVIVDDRVDVRARPRSAAQDVFRGLKM
jgi:hypothetical protein